VSSARGRSAASRPPRVVTVEARAWYNPNLETRWNLLPGLIASLSMIQTLMLAALSVARERENGTFDQLLCELLTRTASAFRVRYPKVEEVKA